MFRSITFSWEGDALQTVLTLCSLYEIKARRKRQQEKLEIKRKYDTTYLNCIYCEFHSKE